MMNYFRSLNPLDIPKSVNNDDQLKVWQERVLHTTLLASLVFGVILSIFTLSSGLDSNNFSLFYGSLVLSGASLILVLIRNTSYWTRSIIALISIYIFSNLIFVQNGWTGVALILLLGFSFLSTTFLFKRPSRIGIGISFVTLLFWAVLRYTNLVTPTELSTSIAAILTDVLIMLLVGLIGNFTIGSLKSRYLEEHSKSELLTVENIDLISTLDEQKVSLEKRLFQLRTASEIAQTISSIFDPQILMQQVSELLKTRFDLYYVGIFMIDDLHEYAILRYGTGEAGKRMLAARHKLAVGGYSMIGWATQTRKSRIALDVGDEAVHFDNPLLPETKSELALPILSGDKTLGAMSVQSKLSNGFDENDILIFQSVADNLAVALENANSFIRTQKAMEDIRVLNKAYVKQAWWDPMESTKQLKVDFENSQIPQLPGMTKSYQVPLKLRDEVIGQINLEIDGTELPKDQLDFLESVSSQTTIALENARLLEETQLAAGQEQKLNELTSQFSRASTIEEILKTAVMEFGKLPMVSEASISLLSSEEYTTFEKKALPSKEEK
jgi:GAF domain-containing protein